MNINKKILFGYLLSIFLLIILSCNTNNSGKKKEDKINRNQEDAKLLVKATKNYIHLVNLNNHIKKADSVTPKIKQFVTSFNTDINERLSTFKELSKEELILIPSKNDVLFFEEELEDSKGKTYEEKYLETLNKMVEKQLNLMNEFVEQTNNISMNVLASESEDFLREQKEKIENIIE